MSNKNIHSRSTALEIIDGHDLTGYEIIVTGGASGIGVETVRAFAKANATVILAARDVVKAKQVADEIIKSTGNNKVEVEQLDLASLKNVRAFVERFLSKKRPLNILVNNAGVMACPFSRTEDGFETQFGTNHLGHFVLTNELISSLRDGAQKVGKKSRVIHLSSCGHSMSNVDFDDPNFNNRAYDKWISYGQSKTANVLHAVGVFNRYKNDGITAFAVHPGIIHTPLVKYMGKEELMQHGWLDADGKFL
jgi:NAD(P)-dependent dehydrogenase (short-subunit alcohol dehydrogenase family)